jgi:hypothetical protein
MRHRSIKTFVYPLGFIGLLLLFFSPAWALQTPPDGGCFVYPSPAPGNSAWVVYNLPQSGTAEIDVYNEAGQLVAQEEASNGAGIQQTGLDLTHYARGVYLCQVILTFDSGGGQTLKLFRFLVVK